MQFWIPEVRWIFCCILATSFLLSHFLTAHRRLNANRNGGKDRKGISKTLQDFATAKKHRCTAATSVKDSRAKIYYSKISFVDLHENARTFSVHFSTGVREDENLGHHFVKVMLYALWHEKTRENTTGRPSSGSCDSHRQQNIGCPEPYCSYWMYVHVCKTAFRFIASPNCICPGNNFLRKGVRAKWAELTVPTHSVALESMKISESSASVEMFCRFLNIISNLYRAKMYIK